MYILITLASSIPLFIFVYNDIAVAAAIDGQRLARLTDFIAPIFLISVILLRVKF